MTGLTIPQMLTLLLAVLFYILSMGATWVKLLEWREDLRWRWENGWDIPLTEHARWMCFCRTSLHRFIVAVFFPVGWLILPSKTRRQ